MACGLAGEGVLSGGFHPPHPLSHPKRKSVLGPIVLHDQTFVSRDRRRAPVDAVGSTLESDLRAMRPRVVRRQLAVKRAYVIAVVSA